MLCSFVSYHSRNMSWKGFVQLLDVHSVYVRPNIPYSVFQFMNIANVRRIFLKFFFLFSMILRSGLGAGQTMDLCCVFLRKSYTILVLCTGALSSWNVVSIRKLLDNNRPQVFINDRNVLFCIDISINDTNCQDTMKCDAPPYH